MASDFEHCKILSKHAVCNNLNGFTHLEYYKEADVKDYIKKILSFVPDTVIQIGVNDDGTPIRSTTHKEIKKYSGNKLVTQSD